LELVDKQTLVEAMRRVKAENMVDSGVSGVYFCGKCGSDMRIVPGAGTTVPARVFVRKVCGVCHRS
jgi:hypothetical protein